MKLLQGTAKELRPLMVFIWAKILAVDSVRRLFVYKCTSHEMHEDVCKDNYFFRVSNENTRAMFMKAELVSLSLTMK